MVPYDTGIGFEADLDVAADQVGVERVGALVRDLLDLEAGLLCEQNRREVTDRADARRADLIRLLGALHQRDQLGDGLDLDARMQKEQPRRRCDDAHGRKILARVVADVAVHARRGREVGGVAEQQRVAIGLGTGDRARADRAAAACGAVLDHDLLAERGAHLVGDGARHDVVGAAGRQRDDERDRPRRIGLRRGRNA